MLCTAILYYFISYSSVYVRCTDNRYTHVNKPVEKLHLLSLTFFLRVKNNVDKQEVKNVLI